MELTLSEAERMLDLDHFAGPERLTDVVLAKDERIIGKFMGFCVYVKGFTREQFYGLAEQSMGRKIERVALMLGAKIVEPQCGTGR